MARTAEMRLVELMVLKQDCKALKALIEATKYDKNRQEKARKQPFRGG